MNKKIFVTGVGVLLLDQITKILVTTYIDPNSSIAIIKNFFSLVNISNTGAAFSFLEGRTVFLVGLTLLLLAVLFKMIPSFKNNIVNDIAFGLLFGGILGNLGDRMFLGSVRDFLKFKIFDYNFPVFNLADAAIVISVIYLIINILKGSGKDETSS